MAGLTRLTRGAALRKAALRLFVAALGKALLQETSNQSAAVGSDLEGMPRAKCVARFRATHFGRDIP
eukprot:10783579-Alexandrium_andersonii.AAC.1